MDDVHNVSEKIITVIHMSRIKNESYLAVHHDKSRISAVNGERTRLEFSQQIGLDWAVSYVPANTV